MTSIKTKLIILVLLIAIVPLSLLGFFNYLKTTDIFTQSVQSSLRTIVQAKANALENYIDATKTAGQAMAANDDLQRYIAYNQDATSTVNDGYKKELERRVDHLLYSFQEAAWGKYHHIFLIDQTRRIVISPNHGATERGSPSSHLGEDTFGNSWAMTALTTGETTVSDYSSWVESDHIHQMLFYPVRDSQGLVGAVIGFELQIPHEQKLLSDDFELGKTGRVILATTKGVPILYKGMESEPKVRSQGIIEAQTTGYSSGRRLNSAGVEVIDLYLKDDKYPWVLIAEIEAQETFRSINELTKYALMGFAVTVFFAFVFSVLFANYVVNPLKKLTGQMERISLGKFDVKLDDINRNDEIGALVKAFDRIVVSLKIVMKRYAKLKAEKNELGTQPASKLKSEEW
jgi:methyl-accepting chemotaxis protein